MLLSIIYFNIDLIEICIEDKIWILPCAYKVLVYTLQIHWQMFFVKIKDVKKTF